MNFRSFGRNKTDCRISVIIYLAAFFYFLFYGARLDSTWNTDEIATLANGALLAGYDWSSAMPGLDNVYFKYLTGIFYSPVFFLPVPPLLRYRCIMGLNALLAAFIPVSAYRLLSRYLALDRKKAVAGSFVTGILPMTSIYAKYAKPDLLLTVLAWQLLLSLLGGREAIAAGDRKRALRSSILSALWACLSYMAHTRGVVFLIAAVLTAACLYRKEKIRVFRPVPFFLTAAGLLTADRFLTIYFKNRIWPNGAGHASLDAFRPEKLAFLFTGKGILQYIKLLTGWFYSIFSSTWGLAALGLVSGVILCLGNRKKNRTTDGSEQVAAWFSVLCFLGTGAMGTLFFFPKVYELLTGLRSTRGDWLIYERYLSTCAGGLCALAWTGVCSGRVWSSRSVKGISFLLNAAVLALFAWKVAPVLSQVKMFARSTSGVVLLLGKKGGTNQVFPEAESRLVLFGVFSLCLFLLILLFSEGKRARTACAVMLILINCCVYHICYEKGRHHSDETNRAKAVAVYKAMQPYMNLNEEYRNLYLGGSLRETVCQLPLAEFHLYSRKSRKTARKIKNLFLLEKSGKKIPVQKKYGRKIKTFRIRKTEYTLYAFGKDLKQQLRSMKKE